MLLTVEVAEYFQGSCFCATSNNGRKSQRLAGQLLSPSRGGLQLRLRCVLRSNGPVLAELLTFEVKSLLSLCLRIASSPLYCCRMLRALLEIIIYPPYQLHILKE